MAFIHFVDRLGSPTALYALSAFITYQFRTASTLWCYGILALLTAGYLNTFFHAVSAETKLRRLGVRAPSVRTYSPFNIAFIAKAVYLVVNHRAQDFWWENFAAASVGKKDPRWTFENIAMGDRLVLTADDENIKAVLATQFGSYGKGPQFRKEWKDFLGLSEWRFSWLEIRAALLMEV